MNIALSVNGPPSVATDNRISSLRHRGHLEGLVLNWTCARRVIGQALMRTCQTELNPEIHSLP